MKPEALRHVNAERTAPNVLTVRVDCQNNRRFLALLRSDAHHDNGHTDQAMERRHLREAVERGAAVLDIGDLHCAMQGKWDRRASRDGMRPEYQSGNYLDRLVECAASFYAPYAEHLLHFSPYDQLLLDRNMNLWKYLRHSLTEVMCHQLMQLLVTSE